MIIGYTTGVYDLFHQGHLNSFKYAKSHCDKLIVGVTTDELSISFKGKKPVVPFEERLSIVAAIKYVDMAVPQTTMDKFEAWKKHKFDVMFVNDDPTKKSNTWQKIEGEFRTKFEKENKHPPKIVYIPYTAGISSTIRKEILKTKRIL